MSEPNPAPEGTPAPAPQNAPQSPAPQPAPQPAPAPTNGAQGQASQQGGIQLSSEQLKERLDRAKESATSELLKQWGVESADEVSAAIKAKRDQEEAQKTLEERLAAERTETEKLRAEHQRYQATVTERADHEMSALTEEQRSAVTSIAGDDPAQRLRTITALRPTWSASAPTPPNAREGAGQSGADPAQPSPPPAKPTSTGVQGTPPNPADTPPASTDLRSQYERLRDGSPKEQMKAASLLRRHGREIYPDQ